MLVISKDKLDELLNHLKEEYPYEACGILAGGISSDGVKEVGKVYRMTNIDKTAESFLMDPKEQFKVMKDMRESNLEMAGIYHSHPETPARPSARDVSMAFYPEVSYVIVSLVDIDKPAAKSFLISKDGIREEEINVK